MNKLVDLIKDIYGKHPFWVIVFLSMLLTLPWITMGEFYTKGEPREATVATCILNTGNWILPSDYADEVAYKPPFMHWFIAAFSLPQGHVTEITARLPSSLGLIGITVLFFSFLYKRKSKLFAALASLILLTSFEMHRSGIEGRVDMFLAFFMIAGLISMYKWEEKGLRGWVYPVLIPVLLGGAALIKGPVGILLPCLVFGVYLMFLSRYPFWKIVLKNVLVAVPALAILSVWYVLAYQQGGKHFLDLVYAENFGRFLGQDSQTLGISYDLGHKGPFWYYIPAIILGFFPWSLLLLFNAVGFPLKKLKPKKMFFFHGLSWMNKMTLFSIISVLIILLFYAIPSSKRSVYIMPAYPFAAYLLAMLYEWTMEFRPRLIKILAYVILSLAGLMFILTLVMAFIDVNSLSGLIKSDRTLHDAGLIIDAFSHPSVLTFALWFVLLAAIVVSGFVLKRKNVQYIAFASLALFISLQVFLEGTAYPAFKNGYSTKPFARAIEQKYDLKGKTYVMNDLRNYMNFYGLNFHLGNNFKNFDKEQPSGGYFISSDIYIEQLRKQYAGRYVFQELERTANRYNDFGNVIILYKIIKQGSR